MPVPATTHSASTPAPYSKGASCLSRTCPRPTAGSIRSSLSLLRLIADCVPSDRRGDCFARGLGRSSAAWSRGPGYIALADYLSAALSLATRASAQFACHRQGTARRVLLPL